MTETEELEKMIRIFRVSELQVLLNFAGKNKTGKKNELQTRALELLNLKHPAIRLKIRKLYKTIQTNQMAHQARNQTDVSSESQIDQNITSRNYYATRQATSHQQQTSIAEKEKELNSDHEVSVTNPVYQPIGYTSVAQYTKNTGYNPYEYERKLLSPLFDIQSTSQYPIHPDVRLKKLPFFDLLGELLKPSSLVPQGSMRLHENIFIFHLTPQQSADIVKSRLECNRIDYNTQVQMRFCLQETSCEQEDHFPSGLTVRINGKLCALPNIIPSNKPDIEPRRPSRPVNISCLVKPSSLSGNEIRVTWVSHYNKRFAIAVYLVRQLSSAELLRRLRNKGVRHSDYTRALIKEKLNEDTDSEIATMSLRVSLACPLGKMRMSMPCRASTCSHLQCFDASLFLQMNERKSTWNCPVCNKPALYDYLVIDGYFQDILNSNKLLPNINEIQLLQDGSWENLILKKENNKDKGEKETQQTTELNDSDIEVAAVQLEKSNIRKPVPKRKKHAVIIDLISDSDDDEDSTMSQSTKKQAIGISSSRFQTSCINSDEYETPELMIIDLQD